MSIKPLPREAVKQIKSSLTITSLNQAVLGLLKNALDASATKIHLSVDYCRGNCTIEDDGHGIPPAEFEETGGLGRLHHTSRYPFTDVQYGSHGDFIASLAALSLISVTSRHRSHESHNTVTLRQAKVLSRNLPALPEHQLLTFSHGTRVTVRDLFGSMAVRVKQRPAANNRVAVEKEFGRLLRQIVALVLAWPTKVSINLRDSTNRHELRLRPSRNGSFPDARLSGRVHRVLVQSGLADDTSKGTWVSVGASARDVSVKGCISLNPAATKRTQFISFGIHPISEDQGCNVLFEEINRVFMGSGFALQDDVNDGQVGQNLLVAREPRPRKTLERWPMFYFRIEALSRESTTSMDPPETLLSRPQMLSHAAELLTMLCFEFLKKHHFQPREVPRTSRSSRNQSRAPSAAAHDETASATSGTSGSNTPNQRPASPFDFWQRVKVGSANHALSRSITASSKSGQPKTFDAGAQSLKDDSKAQKLATQTTRSIIEKSEECSGPSSADAASPACQQTHKLSGECPVAETLRVEPPESTDLAGSVSGQACNRETVHSDLCEESLGELATRASQDAATLNKEPSEWLQGMLSAWETSIFSSTEASIPKIEGAITTSAIESDSLGPNLADASNLNLSAIRRQGRLFKGALANAEVISQVDQKYILVKMWSKASGEIEQIQCSQDRSLLAFVDQHAADERCRLEALMRDYFFRDERGRLRAQTVELKSTLKFEFDAKEIDLLRRFSHRFEHWGILYKFVPGRIHEYFPKSKHPGILEVVSLPPAISERGQTEARLVSDLLRNEIWKLEEDGGLVQAQTQSAARGEAGWVSHFQGCPQGILDLLNSRSCRGAIMFNDVLSHEECQDLIQRLSQCSFPFQCAHGRPSMAPLIDLSIFSNTLSSDAQFTKSRFGDRLKKTGLAKRA